MDNQQKREEKLSINIFTVSAGLIGVCITLIGIINVFCSVRSRKTIIDDLVVFNAIGFLAACILSYCALRTRNNHNFERLERFADGIFLISLTGLIVICLMMVYIQW